VARQHHLCLEICEARLTEKEVFS